MILPFTVGRNILEITLLDRREIYGYTLFDVKYFFSIYLSDVFLLLIYQNYLSYKFSGKEKSINITINSKFALLSFAVFILLTALRSINHEFGSLTILSTVILIKFLLIFSLPALMNVGKHINKIIQLIAASSFFQVILIAVEQFKGGNAGIFIEKTLPGFEIGTYSSEAIDILRANGTFNEANIAAAFLLINFCILLAAGLNRKLLYLFISLVSLLAIIFTGSRSLYFLTFFVIIFYLFLYKNEVVKICRGLFKNAVVKIFLASCFIIMFPYFLNRISSIRDVFNEKGGLSYRVELAKHTLMLSQKNILGIGLDLTPFYLAKNFKTIDSDIVIFDQAPAHNMLIQIFAETGIFGLISFLLFLYFAVKNEIISGKLINPMILASIAYLLVAQFHPVFTTHPEILAFFFLYLGMVNYVKLKL